MEKTSSWLITIFISVFWVFRLIVAISAQSGESFSGFIAFDNNIEIILLFITVLSFIMITKRKLIGAIIYIITYGYYFGGYIYKQIIPILISGNGLSEDLIQNSIICVIALLLSIFALLDLIFEKITKKKYSDSKTDWFFDDKKTDREIDKRADKNQYKIY